VLSERLQVPLLERRAWDALFARSGADHLYVVGRAHEEVRNAQGASCFVQEGLLATKLGEGARHPFIRALAGNDGCTSLLDGTLGLANDALHAALVLGGRIVGVEGSPVLHALLEEGLVRLARAYPAAAPIELRFGRTLEVLRSLPTGGFDVVFLDPMMSKPKKSAPSFEVLRDFAVPDRATPELLEEAARVAKRRVVLKLGKGAPLPPGSPLPFSRRELGAHVIYWIHDVGGVSRPG
jgi:hypothetical protein